MSQRGLAISPQPERAAEQFDPLTGLITGFGFESRLGKLLEGLSESDAGPGVLLVGMDRFRKLNGLLGFEAGDRALVAVADRLRSAAGPVRLVARMGGDEFGILLPPPLRPETVTAFGINLLHAIAAPLSIEGKEYYLSASVGIAFHPQSGTTTAELLQSAIWALERAKQRGGNAVEMLAVERPVSHETRFQLESELRRAMERDEFTLRFQPQVDREGRLAAMEALISWQNPNHGRVDTETFIRLAEETGQIGEIGHWVLVTVCRQIGDWIRRGFDPPRVAVNVSPIQFNDPAFVERIAQVLREHQVPGRCLELEVTENAVLRDLEESARRMSRLRALGISIAIDDFGVGYSPLTYLHSLPLDAVKVDRTFVGSSTKPMGTLPVLHTISVMAQNRGLRVVAEGIETAAELEVVQAARFDRMQGFLFSTPLTCQEIEALMLDPEPLSRHFRESLRNGIVF